MAMYNLSMITLGGIVTGIILTALGVLGLRFTFQIAGFTGRQDWIESKLGSGTTYGAYKFFSVILVLVGILEAIGMLHGVMAWLLSPLQQLFPKQ